MSPLVDPVRSNGVSPSTSDKLHLFPFPAPHRWIGIGRRLTLSSAPSPHVNPASSSCLSSAHVSSWLTHEDAVQYQKDIGISEDFIEEPGAAAYAEFTVCQALKEVLLSVRLSCCFNSSGLEVCRPYFFRFFFFFGDPACPMQDGVMLFDKATRWLSIQQRCRRDTESFVCRH